MKQLGLSACSAQLRSSSLTGSHISHKSVIAPGAPLFRGLLVRSRASKGSQHTDSTASNAGHRRQPDQSTTTHAYAEAVQPAVANGSVSCRQPVARPAKQEIQQQQQQQQQRHHAAHHTAYSFMAPNWEPLVGRSKQHMRVEKEVLKASQSTSPLVVSGDVGLNTLHVAATVHALGLGDEDASHPMVVIDCCTPSGVSVATQLLLGRSGGVLPGSEHTQLGSLDVSHDVLLTSALTGGILVLDNVHKATKQLLDLANAAVGTLLPPSPQQQQQQQQQMDAAQAAAATAAAAEGQPGSFLKAHSTRLILVSQLPLAQLLSLDQIQEVPTKLPTGIHSEIPSQSGLKDCPSIALPALRARSSDIPVMAVAAGQATAALRGYSSIRLTNAAEKQLTSYEFPGNEAELQGLVQRAIMLHPPAPTAAAAAAEAVASKGARTESEKDGRSEGPVLVLDGGDFWAATGDADRGRVDVLEVLPWLRKYILDTGFWPVGVNNIVSFMYPLVLLSLFLGPQDRESSAALTVFWAGWWPLVMLSFPFVGRAWCAMCPFMITGEAAQHLAAHEDPTGTSNSSSSSTTTATKSNKQPSPQPAAAETAVSPAGLFSSAAAAAASVSRGLPHLSGAAAHMVPHSWQLQKWPTEAIEPWAGWFVIAAFAGILMWEQVWDLPGHADLSGWLLVLITSGAVACSVLFERRLWCRYLCPIGAMNGLFAKLSMTEIRNRPQLCAAAACTKPCHKGRVEHHTVQMPVSNPASSTKLGFTIPSWLKDLTPWGSGSSKTASDGSVSSSGSSVGAFTCSAYLDASSPCEFAGNGNGTVTPTGSTPAAAAATAAPAGAAGGTVLVERDVVFPGCPLNSSPGRNKDNSQCIMCGNCLRSCTSGSAQWRLRPPAADLWRDHQASWTEVHLMNVLLGSVLLHKLPVVCSQLGLPADEIMSEKGPHLLLCAALLAAPSALSWLFHKAAAAAVAMDTMAAKSTTAAAARPSGNGSLAAVGLQEGQSDAVQDGQSEGVSWLKLSYSVLPLVWAGILAHYEQLLLTELGLIAPRLAISLGAPLTASWLPILPTIGPVSDDVVAAAQGVTLFIGTALSLALAGKIGSVEVQHGRAQIEEIEKAVLPQRLLTLLMAAELWHLIM